MNVSSKLKSLRNVSTVSRPWIVTGPGASIVPSRRTPQNVRPNTSTSKPALTLGVDVERRELDDRVDVEEAVGAAAGGADAGLEVTAELHGVGGHGEVALGAHVDARHGEVEVEAEPPHRRDLRRLGTEAGKKPPTDSTV